MGIAVAPSLTRRITATVFCVLVAAGCGGSFEEGAATVQAWLDGMSGATADRGWSLLGQEAQATYNFDQAAYVADAASVDWDALDPSVGPGYVDDGFATVTVKINGGWNSVAAFIRNRPLGQIACGFGSDVAFVVIVSVGDLRNPLQPARIGAGARTGDAERGDC